MPSLQYIVVTGKITICYVLDFTRHIVHLEAPDAQSSPKVNFTDETLSDIVWEGRVLGVNSTGKSPSRLARYLRSIAVAYAASPGKGVLSCIFLDKACAAGVERVIQGRPREMTPCTGVTWEREGGATPSQAHFMLMKEGLAGKPLLFAHSLLLGSADAGRGAIEQAPYRRGRTNTKPREHAINGWQYHHPCEAISGRAKSMSLIGARIVALDEPASREGAGRSAGIPTLSLSHCK
jgi:hypothetical protein